ncbi:MAG: D-cysteine desulfhydrase family protein [Planctomycetota bacterium]|jgi:1-aminocyclopropane-1-carboxylate deaminase/D-cysteine desulfhydrase-like pyridoxal-dependent ACC family enzyme
MSSHRPFPIDAVRLALDHVPRFALGHLPTPLEPLNRLSEELGGPTIWIKRDDCTGLAFGGNKTRHNGYLLGQALAEGADCFVWGAGVQSNNCRQTVAACAKAGLPCHLVLTQAHHQGEVELQGNLLLDHLLGGQLREQGRQPFFWNRFSVKAIAAIGYVPCLLEIVEQSRAAAIEPAAVYVSSAGSTGSGLALGAAAVGLQAPVRNIAPLVWPWDTAEDMANIANDAAQRLRLPHRLETADISLTEDYIGPDYGVPSEDGLEALRLLARTESILLDPVYSAKAFAALIDHIRRGEFSTTEHVVFVHTGGLPALFAMHDELDARVPGQTPPF